MSKKAVENSSPSAWAIVSLEKVITTKKGKKPKDLGELTPSRNIAYIDIKAFDSKVIRQYCTNENVVLCNESDVLVVWDGSRSGLVGIGANGAVGSTIAKIEAPLIESKFLYYFLQSKFVYLNTNTRGVGIPHVDPGIFNNLEFPLAPRGKQKQIVAKIEELFSHIDSGIEGLKKTKALLKQYRQSVLKAAVTGELTKQWREENKDKLEPASKLLERILVERRKKWEAQQMEQFKTKGKVPKDDGWKGKYVEPDSNVTLPFEIPEEWLAISLDCIVDHIEAGKSFKCDERPPVLGETGIVKVSAVSWGEFDSNESKTITDKNKINDDYKIHVGDFLFSRANTIELVGACVIVKKVDKDLLLSDKILRFILSNEWKEWLLLCLRTQHGRDEIESLATGNQDSMRNIGQAKIRNIRIPLLSVNEMKQAISLFNGKVDAIQRLEVEIDKLFKKAEKNKQSILAAAFSGRLT